TWIDARPGALRAVVGGVGAVIRADVVAPEGQTVAFVYADPGDGEHYALNCSIAEVRLRVSRPRPPTVELADAVRGGAVVGVLGGGARALRGGWRGGGRAQTVSQEKTTSTPPPPLPSRSSLEGRRRAVNIVRR